MTTALNQLKQTAHELMGSMSDSPFLGTAAIRAFGLTKIPMLYFLRPSVVETSASRCVVKIPLTRRSKNHLGVMYLGALVVGADLAAGITAMRCIRQSGKRVHLLFKDLQVDFIRRVEGDAHFVCEDVPAIEAAVQQAVETGRRVNHPVPVVAQVPAKLGEEPVAKFTLTLTLKLRR